MSGIEAVGLLASVSQLATYTINICTLISEIYHKIQNAPKIIQERIQQLEELIVTTRQIKNRALLHTENISAHIQSTLHHAKVLYTTLDKVKQDYLCSNLLRRYWKILKGDREKEILASFKRLEQEKSALLLNISVVHTDLLGNIQGNLELSSDNRSVKMSGSQAAGEDKVNPIPCFSHLHA